MHGKLIDLDAEFAKEQLHSLIKGKRAVASADAYQSTTNGKREATSGRRNDYDFSLLVMKSPNLKNRHI
ncbi:hypothetical protein P4S64_11280 [Vibrio sp. M60_M31a]